MRKIGISGGNSTYERGTTSDMELFFECINYFVVRNYAEVNWNLLTDRLYRRYLRLEELEPASELMDKVKEIFSATSMIGDRDKTWLDPTQKNLGLVFVNFFAAFDKAKESALYFYGAYKEYLPVKIIITDFLFFIRENKRPLVQYDELSMTDEPFWLYPRNYEFMDKTINKD